MGKLKDISTNIKVFILFIIILLVTSIFTNYIPYSNWWSLIEDTSVKTADSLNEEIMGEIDEFMRESKQLNLMNKSLLEKNLIDIKDQVERESFFVNSLTNFKNKNMYSFSYGSKSGDYYGARRNENNQVEIMRNNDESLGRSMYYSAKNGRAENLVLDAGNFDPRTREWYRVVEKKGEASFSPIYKHFVLDDLAISHGVPIYDENEKLEGVLGTHINLSRIDRHLKNLFHKGNACGIIIEKQTNNIVASCSEQAYFKKTEDGEYKRLEIDKVRDKRMVRAYEEYLENKTTSYKINKDNRDLHIRVTDYENEGIEWIVLTLLPESPMLASVKNSIKLGLTLTILVILVSSYVFFRAMKTYMDPINRLIKAQKAFAEGDLLKRVEIKRKDEIGMLTSSFNFMADMIYNLVNDLERQVEERTQELKKSKDYLETTLLSVGDGIIVTDEKGIITLMNPVIEKLTGWSIEEAYGKALKEILIAICEEEGESYKNPVKQILQNGKTMERSGQPMLVCKSQEKIYVEYTAAPIKDKDNKVVGSVVVLKDITNEKKHLDKIKYLSRYDQLTGLYNRWYMEERLSELDKEEHLPLTIMVIDVNGLKLVNDAFGHEKGDELLKLVSRVLKSVLRKEDIIGRIGGDEFLILLPKVREKEAKLLRQRILEAVSLEKMEPIVVSVAIGYSIREKINQSIKEIRIDADNKMYENKILYGKNMRNQTIERLLKNINFKYDQEEIHAERVSQYCEALGKAMGFSKYEIEDLKTIGRLHDIGKIVVPPDLLSQAEKLTEKEFKLIKKHPETGYHILKSVDEYMGIAEDILYHHENWDGTGYPKGLKAKEIPINSRIVAVADAFEAMTAKRPYTKTKTKEEAIKELEKCAGSQFDPHIVKVFIEKVLK